MRERARRQLASTAEIDLADLDWDSEPDTGTVLVDLERIKSQRPGQ
jgi:hypothetical protein